MRVRDEDGVPLNVGDHITFSFGVPPTSVLAVIVEKGTHLWIECLHPDDVKPRQERLDRLMKWYPIWRAPKSRVSAASRDFRPRP